MTNSIIARQIAITILIPSETHMCAIMADIIKTSIAIDAVIIAVHFHMRMCLGAAAKLAFCGDNEYETYVVMMHSTEWC